MLVVSSELYNTCSANDEFQCLGATVIATTQIRNCSEGINVLHGGSRGIVYKLYTFVLIDLARQPTTLEELSGVGFDLCRAVGGLV